MVRKNITAPKLHNEHGVIDLASIMVGIIVIGMIGGIVASTIFAVIPWAQDKAAKQQLDSINVAQAAYKAKASDPTTAGEGFVTNSYADSTGLGQTRLLAPGPTYCTAPTDEGYAAYSRSATGRVFTITDSNTAPREYTVKLKDTLLPGCEFLKESLTVGEPPPEEEENPPDTSPTTITTITYECDVLSVGALPFQDIVEGKLTIEGSDGSRSEGLYAGEHITDYMEFEAGVEYKVTFDGEYKIFRQSYEGIAPSCMRSIDHWGSETGVIDASSGALNATNLVSVPDSIPTTVTNLNQFFQGATKFNDPSVSQWDVSNVTKMNSMFNNAKAFNQPLENWNVSKVTDVRSMFMGATLFSRDLSSWTFDTLPLRTNFNYIGFPAQYLPQQFK